MISGEAKISVRVIDEMRRLVNKFPGGYADYQKRELP